jgi:hypothetical protein
MTRRTLLSALTAIVAMTFLMVFASAERVSAQQNPNCCTYTVERIGLGPNCVNIRLSLRWNCGGTGVGTITSYGTNGITIEPIGVPPLTPCPPACTLLAISLDNINFVGPNTAGTWHVGGCCYKAAFTYDAAGCIYIKIKPC